MKISGLVLIILISVVAVAFAGNKWAILVAGSNTYSNYRHQADVFHAYQLLRKNNFSADRIITFAYDDVAHNIKNPFKGKVFNKPTNKDAGVDVYEGVNIDYKGKDVQPAVFLEVLLGNKTAVHGKGSGRVLESTAEDNVFLYFADHGAPGLIAFPSKYLYATQMLETFAKMKGKYNKFVFYLEACESGSMFVNLPTNTGIYALSAANTHESSWGTYCSPQDVIQGKHIGSCLGDLFSINFLESTELHPNLATLTLTEQFKEIQRLTTKSHVMQWGDLSYNDNTVDQFLKGSNQIQRNTEQPRFNLRKQIRKFIEAFTEPSVIDSRFMKVKTLAQIYARQKSPETFEELQEEMRSMQRTDNIFTPLIEEFELDGRYDAKKINFECLQGVIEDLEEEYGRTSDYGLIYFKYITQACEKIQAEVIKKTLKC